MRGRPRFDYVRARGFTDVVGTATVEYDGTPEAAVRRADLGAALLEGMADVAVSEGWSTAVEMRQLAQACRAWGREPGAFDAVTWCEAVGWKR